MVFSAVAPEQQRALGGKVEVRLDSASGRLVGATDAIRPTAGPVQPVQYRAALEPTEGPHDVYLVFRNEQAAGDQLLFVLLTATFGRGSDPAAGPGPR